MARPLRSWCAAAPTVVAAGSNDAELGDCCEESRPSLGAPLNANPGNCCEELPLPVPETRPIRIATAQTKIAVIHAICTATRPVNLASDVPFTMTVWSRYRILGPGDWYPREGQMPPPLESADFQCKRHTRFGRKAVVGRTRLSPTAARRVALINGCVWRGGCLGTGISVGSPHAALD
jgi:hypothetical protein